MLWYINVNLIVMYSFELNSPLLIFHVVIFISGNSPLSKNNSCELATIVINKKLLSFANVRASADLDLLSSLGKQPVKRATDFNISCLVQISSESCVAVDTSTLRYPLSRESKLQLDYFKSPLDAYDVQITEVIAK